MQQLLRTSVLDALQNLLEDRDWSRITLADIAKRVGISRQTLYNEFGSRTGLAQAYAVRLSDGFVDHVEIAIGENENDVESALKNGIQAFLLDAAGNPLIQSLLTGDPNNELLRLVTVNSEPILIHATERLEEVFRESWVKPPAVASVIFARMAVRLAMSYIAMPPEPGSDVAADFAALLTPFVASLLEEKSSPTAP
jgi:AcrR family transcriptional regulator